MSGRYLARVVTTHEVWPPGEREGTEGDAYVFVDDAYALFDELTDRGAPMHRPVSRAPNYDMADFVVESPEGHRICFGSPV